MRSIKAGESILIFDGVHDFEDTFSSSKNLRLSSRKNAFSAADMGAATRDKLNTAISKLEAAKQKTLDKNLTELKSEIKRDLKLIEESKGSDEKFASLLPKFKELSEITKNLNMLERKIIENSEN